MSKPIKKYHVKLWERFCTEHDDITRLYYEQDTWAPSAKKAEANVRHNSGRPWHGWANVVDYPNDAASFIYAEVEEL